jgi:hypothetical protein
LRHHAIGTLQQNQALSQRGTREQSETCMSDVAQKVTQAGAPDHLYVMQNTRGDIKIGRSVNPKVRLTKLRAGSSCAIALIAVFNGRGSDEAAIFSEMQDHAMAGVWFRNTASAIAILTARLGPLNLRRRPDRKAAPGIRNEWDDLTPGPNPVAEKLAALKTRRRRNARFRARARALRRGE